MSCAAGLLSDAHAATFVWDGGHPGQSNWTASQNWNPNGAPANDGTSDLIFTGSIRLTTDANGGWNVNSLTFDSFAGAFTVIGDAITIQGSGVTYAIANNSSFGATINNALILATAQTWHADTGALAFGGTIALNGNLSLEGAADFAASGAISGTGALLKTGTGTLTLTGVNSYSGGTTITAGTLSGTAASLPGNVSNSGALVFNQSTSGTYSGVISGTGSLGKEGAGNVTLSVAQSFTGNTTITGGTLALGATDTIVTSTTISVGSGGTLQLAGGNQAISEISGAGSVDLGSFVLTTGSANTSTEIGGAITGTGSLVKIGTGTLTLSGTNSYSGGTTVNAGTLQGTSSGLQGNISLAASTGVVFDQTTSGTFAGAISGAGSLTKQGSGSVTLTGANSFTGATAINGGTLGIGANNALPTSNVVTIASGATLHLSGGSQALASLDGAGNITLGGFTLTTGSANTSTALSGNITGTGALVKTGTGTLTLSGTNSYSGGTTVSDGTLLGTTASVQGAILNNAAVVFNQSTTGTYSGAMSGTGSLLSQGTGTVILTGTNTYSGGTTVGAGTLQGSATSLQGGILNNAAVVFDQTGTGTYAGVMSGTGSLTKQNSGTLIVTGANTYTGGTTVTGGILQGTTSSLQGNIVDHATVAFNQTTNGTYGGVISGTGSLLKQGTGTVILTGGNTYSGGTTVSAGTLQGNTTSLGGNVVNNAAVVFDQASAGTYSGNMSGTGSLTKENGGTLTVTGTNTYTGGTTVSAGTLHGSATSVQGNITNNAALVFDQATSGTFSGNITGIGTVTKQGSGTLTLTGTGSTYTGSTSVTGGTLAIGAANATSASSALTLGSATTFAMNGFSTQVGTLSYNTSIIDFGTPGAYNAFVFNGGGASTGTLTINNFSATDGDVFAYRNGSTINSSFMPGVYFYGLGAGLVSATNQSVSGFTGLFDLITPNTAAFKVWDGGSTNSNNWNSANNWSGNTVPTLGTTLRIAFDGTLRPTPNVNVAATLNTLRFNSTATAFSLTASGPGALAFGGSVPSIIQLSTNPQSINVPTTLNATTIVETTGAGTLTLLGVIGGTGGITKVGTETLVLKGANTYTGVTTIAAGTVSVQNSLGLGSAGTSPNEAASGTTVSAGATLQLLNTGTNVIIAAEWLTLNGTLTSTSGANQYNGPISGAGGITVAGGSLSLGTATNNTYTGTTTITGGTLTLAKTGGAVAVGGDLSVGAGSVVLSGSEQIANTSAVSLTAATSIFNLGTNTETIGSLSGTSATGSVVIGTGGSLTTGDSSSTTFAGVISGAGTLTKQGSGEMTLSGANSYTGATTVSAGTLIAQNDAALGGTAAGTTVNSGATLQLQGNISIGAEALTLNGALTNASGTNTYGGAISGTGTIAVNGGALTLSGTGANTNTGTTTVNAGTLTLAKSPSTTAVAGNLVIGAGMVTVGAAEQIANTSAVSLTSASSVFAIGANTETIGSLAGGVSGSSVTIGSLGHLKTGDASSTTFAGNISGAGQMTKQGTGTFTLTGTNNYSGGTTVTAGTLQGNSSSLQGAIVNNAAVVFDQSSSGIYGGNMSGTGSLTKQNSGALTLSGTNTYSGGTTVAAGILQGSTTSLQGAITNNAAVVFDQTSTGTYAGVMSGTGSLTKQNTGTVVLTGANTYSGGTTISGGTLQGNTTSLQGSITNNATLAFDQSTNGTFAGVISGTGALSKTNSGTLTLTGANAYSGGTTVSGGTLQGNATSLQGNIANNAALVFDQSTSGTYAGVISGTGSFTKTNSGTLTLTGANTYTGATTVSGGELTLGASNALATTTSLTLSSGTTLALAGAASQRIGEFNFTDAALNFGTPGSANYFLIGSAGTTTGNLTISNWTSGSDIFGVATNSVSQTFLDSLIFTGTNGGVGAVLSSTTTTVPGYGAFYTLTPISTFTWTGGQSTGNVADMDNWTKGGNWVGGSAPAIGGVKSIIFGGSVKLDNDMNSAYLLRSLTFRADAGAFTINSSTGDTLTIGSLGIINLSTNNQTLNVPIFIDAAQTWDAASGNITINGDVTNGAHTLTIDGAANTTIAGDIGPGSGGIVKDGAGMLTLGGTNTFTGGVALNAGVVAVSVDGNLGGASGGLTFNGGTLRATASLTSGRAVALDAGGGTFDADAGTSSTFNGVISGAGGLTKEGTGTVTLSGTNTFTGGVTLNAGVVSVANDANLGASSGGVTFDGGTLRTSADVTSARAITLQAGGGTLDASAGTTSTLTGVISGSGGLNKSGTGIVLLEGANTYSGGTTVAAGTLQGNATSLQGNITNNAAVIFNQTTAGTYAGNMAGTGSLTKIGGATLTLSGTNTYTGATFVNAGTLALSASNTLASTTALTISSGATFDMTGLTQTVGSLAGAGTIALGNGTLRIGSDHSNTTFGGAITGAGIIEKIGNGTLTFNAGINIAGDLTLTGGTLALAGVNLSVGGTLRITGNTVLDFGLNSASILTATNVVIDSGVLLTITNWVDLQDYFFATGTFSQFNPGTNTSIFATPGHPGPGAPPQNQVAFNGFSNNATAWLPWDRQISPTPEPSTYGALMIGSALGFLGYRRWRKRRLDA